MGSSERELGKYTLVAELARGGMGVVYLAQLQGPGGFQKLVVVKQLKTELAEDPSFRDMFLEEANLAARLNHRNIVQTNEVSQEGDRYFMAMDYLEGCSLHAAHKRLKGERKLTVAMELRVLGEILAGLHYAHEVNDYDGTPLGIVHRDVGPQNVYLTFDGQVKLLDFGVAKALNRQQETQAGVLKGRVAYMAPEQVGGSGVDRRADIFAAGVMLRELVTGLRLWEGLSEIDTLKRLINRDLPPFPADATTPAELRAICEKAMAPDREDRFKTAHEMRVAIDKYVSRVDPAGSLTDVGAHLTRELVAERKKLKDIVDAHLAAGGAGSVPSVDFPMVSPSYRELPGELSGASSSRRLLKTPASGTLSSGVAPDSHVDIEARQLPRPKDRRSVIAVGIVLVGLGLLAVALVVRRGGRAQADDASARASALHASAPPIALPPPAAPSAAGAGEPDTVEMTIRVTPANAQIFIDDALVDGNPFRARFPRNGSAMHSVRAVAPGFVGKSELVKFDANNNVMLSLERHVGPTFVGVAPRSPEPRSVPASPPAPAPAALATTATPAKTTDINPKGGKPPKRDIDPKNPYGVE